MGAVDSRRRTGTADRLPHLCRQSAVQCGLFLLGFLCRCRSLRWRLRYGLNVSDCSTRGGNEQAEGSISQLHQALRSSLGPLARSEALASLSPTFAETRATGLSLLLLVRCCLDSSPRVCSTGFDVPFECRLPSSSVRWGRGFCHFSRWTRDRVLLATPLG